MSDLGEIRYTRSVNNAVQRLEVSWKPVQEMPYFSYRRECNYIYACTVELCGILEVKNALV
jgi:hypothetical protein